MEILILLIALILTLGLLDFAAMRWGRDSRKKDTANDRDLAALLMNERYSN